MTSPGTTPEKKIHMSNNVSSLPRVDMYQDISKDIVDKTSESTQFNAEQLTQ
ncbi:hypothetical protein L3K73_09230 [Holdemanella sp. SCCA2]|nr:hypothetical protein [Holdemanella sp. SCCA2]